MEYSFGGRSVRIMMPMFQTFFEEFEIRATMDSLTDLTDPAVADSVQKGLDNLVSFVKQYVVED